MSERQTAAQRKTLGRVFWIGLIVATLSLLFILGPDLPKSIDVAFNALLIVLLVVIVGDLRR